MHNPKFFFIVCLLALVSTMAGQPASAAVNQQGVRGKIVVANREDGTISVISVRTDEVIQTVAMPEGDNTPDPMYVVYTRPHNRVFVGDRGNNRVVVFNADDFSVEATVPTGAGVFHMWADSLARQLWVNNDVDKTATVIDPRTLEVLATVPMPADLTVEGKPHDVVIDHLGRFAFVSMVKVKGDNDYVIKFSTETFEEVGRAAVGKDPHLALTFRNRFLYVPTQNANEVLVLNRDTMETETSIAAPGAHGAGMARFGNVFYTTNLPGEGMGGLYAIDIRTNSVIGKAVDTPFPVPHNIALTPILRKLYVTHSGTFANKVTVYTVSRQNPVPVYRGSITVGLNPFGLSYVQ